MFGASKPTSVLGVRAEDICSCWVLLSLTQCWLPWALTAPPTPSEAPPLAQAQDDYLRVAPVFRGAPRPTASDAVAWRAAHDRARAKKARNDPSCRRWNCRHLSALFQRYRPQVGSGCQRYRCSVPGSSPGRRQPACIRPSPPGNRFRTGPAVDPWGRSTSSAHAATRLWTNLGAVRYASTEEMQMNEIKETYGSHRRGRRSCRHRW